MNQTNQTIPKPTTQEHLTWIDEEQEQNKAPICFERKEYLKLSENKIETLEIDFSKPFQVFNTINHKGQDIKKAIIPVKHEGKEKVWWLNKRNPVYREILQKGKDGITTIKILQTGSQANTKYVLIQ